MLVIQADAFNRSAIATVICAAITSNVSLGSAAANILIEKNESKLDKTSVINFSQIMTIDKSSLTEQVSMISKSMLAKVNRSLKIVFDIE